MERLCVIERERDGERDEERERERVCVCVCVRERERERERERYEREREREERERYMRAMRGRETGPWTHRRGSSRWAGRRRRCPVRARGLRSVTARRVATQGGRKIVTVG